jgi:hypothetical protein
MRSEATPFNKLPKFSPTPRMTSLPEALNRRCASVTCGGPFRTNWRSETQSESGAVVTYPPDLACPTCGGPSVDASEPPPRVFPRTPVPAAMADDSILAKLLVREAALPIEITKLEARLQELKAHRKQGAEAIGTLKVRVSVGVAKQTDLDRATENLDQIERDIREAEGAMDVAVASQRAVVEEVEKRAAVLRDARKKPLIAAARKFRDEITIHFEAIERLIREADAIGTEYAPIYHRDQMVNGAVRSHDDEAALAVGILRHLAAGRRGSKPIAALIARFRTHASRL